MWNGKNKAVTFSFDDGVFEDIRVMEIFSKYGLKGSFNVNSGWLGLRFMGERFNRPMDRCFCPKDALKGRYEGFEVCSHTRNHDVLPPLTEEQILHATEYDRQVLSDLLGYEVQGMAYTAGYADDRVMKILREKTKIKFARTGISTFGFDLPDELLFIKPTFHINEPNVMDTVNKFMELKTDKPQLLYIWGHAYEMTEGYTTWAEFEEICKTVANDKDIFYGTNSEVFLDK